MLAIHAIHNYFGEFLCAHCPAFIFLKSPSLLLPSMLHQVTCPNIYSIWHCQVLVYVMSNNSCMAEIVSFFKLNVFVLFIPFSFFVTHYSFPLVIILIVWDLSICVFLSIFYSLSNLPHSNEKYHTVFKLACQVYVIQLYIFQMHPFFYECLICHSLYLVVFYYIQMPHFFNPIVFLRYVGWCQDRSDIICAAVTIGLHVVLWDDDIKPLGKCLAKGHLGHMECLISVFRNVHSNFHNKCASLHSY